VRSEREVAGARREREREARERKQRDINSNVMMANQ
jgi:hypothetical protein